MNKLLLKAIVNTHIFLYRSTGGRIGGKLAGLDHLLLTTTGARSNKQRTIPIVCKPHGEGFLIVASNNGQDRHPAWYHNLVKHPDVSVQFHVHKHKMRARTISAQEREELWPQLKTYNRMFARYEKRTSREIPVVMLE